jgi:hypothetical protein
MYCKISNFICQIYLSNFFSKYNFKKIPYFIHEFYLNFFQKNVNSMKQKDFFFWAHNF